MLHLQRRRRVKICSSKSRYGAISSRASSDLTFPCTSESGYDWQQCSKGNRFRRRLFFHATAIVGRSWYRQRLGCGEEPQRKAKPQQIAFDHQRQLPVRGKSLPIRDDHAVAERIDLYPAIELGNLENAQPVHARIRYHTRYVARLEECCIWADRCV
jgi:hypothetical protein